MSVTLLEIVTALRHDVAWENDIANDYSVETLQRTYQSAQGFPGEVEINQKRAELEAAHAALADREETIEAARVTEGLADITLEQAQDYMETMLDTSGLSLAEFDAAADFASVKAAIRNLMIDIYNQFEANREVHLREIPYILK